MRYAVIVADPELAHAKERERTIDYHVAILGEDQRAMITAVVEAHLRTPPPLGATITEGERGCPDGHPWCEHCGDPAHQEACIAAGHCPACIASRHGAIAHPTVIAANGYALIEVDRQE